MEHNYIHKYIHTHTNTYFMHASSIQMSKIHFNRWERIKFTNFRSNWSMNLIYLIKCQLA